VGLSGETGVGKSRLLSQFREAIADSGEVHWHEGHHDGPWLSATRNALAGLFGIQDPDHDPVADLITTCMARWGSAEADIARLIDLFVLPNRTPEDADGFADAKSSSGIAVQEQLFGSIERVLRRAAAQHPIALVLEDVHWAGHPTRALLEYLVPRLKTTPAPILLIATFRSDAPEMGAWSNTIDALRKFEPSSYHHMEIPRLDPDESRELVQAMAAASTRLIDAVTERTGGNPLHTIQVLRFLDDSAMLTSDAGIWDLAPGHRLESAVPPEMKDLLLERLRRALAGNNLETVFRRIIDRCAIVGHRIPYRLLVQTLEAEAAAQQSAAGLVDRLEEALDFFTDAGLLREDPDAHDDVLEFCHGLLRESLVSQMRGRRNVRGAHLAAAETKSEFYAKTPDVHANIIANHYEEARSWRNAVDWYVRAAEVARLSWDLPASEERFRHARALTDRTDPSPGLQLRIAQGLGDLCHLDGRYAEADAHYADAFDAAERAGNSLAMAHTLFRRGNAAREQRNFKRADASYRECLAVSRALGDRAGIGSALLGLGLLHGQRGQAEDAHRFIAAAEEQFALLEDQRSLADCNRQRAYVFMQVGQWRPARACLLRARELCSAIEDRRQVAYIERDLARLSVIRGKYNQGQLHARKALDIFEEIGAQFGVAQTLVDLGTVHHSQGHFQAASDLFQRALETFENLRADRESTEAIFRIGCVALLQGRPREASQRFLEALERAAACGHQSYIGLSLAADAWAAARQDKMTDARDKLQEAHRHTTPQMDLSPDLAQIYKGCAAEFERGGHPALAGALRKKATTIWTRLGRDADGLFDGPPA
jgi:tetratricopeptide (TPR) repeat protein